MSDIIDTIFGGTDDSAQTEQIRQNAAAAALIAAKGEEARADVLDIFPAAGENRQLGFDAALRALSGAVPQQIGAFQQGNVGAQAQLLSGLPQVQNAILGRAVDTSGFAPQTIDFSTLFARQQTPDFIGIPDVFGARPGGFSGVFGGGGITPGGGTTPGTTPGTSPGAPPGGGVPGGQDFGTNNPDLARQLAEVTGFTGNFGGGEFQAFLAQQPLVVRTFVDALIQQNAAPGGAVPTPGGAPGVAPTQDFGTNNPDLARQLAGLTGFTGSFGGGEFNQFRQGLPPITEAAVRNLLATGGGGGAFAIQPGQDIGP